jgi:hypothetical protein
MKWPRLAPHSRASLADALATITPLLTRETSRRPPDQRLRAALYGYAFNPQRRRSGAPDPAGFQNSATCADLGFYATRSYSLMRPPRTDRRWILWVPGIVSPHATCRYS